MSMLRDIVFHTQCYKIEIVADLKKKVEIMIDDEIQENFTIHKSQR